MDQRWMRFESEARLAELKLEETLAMAGFKEGMTCVDIGAGSGVWTFAAAKVTSSPVYAVDINPEMLDLLNKRITDYETAHVRALHADEMTGIEEGSVDLLILSAVLHGIRDVENFMRPIQRIMKPDGRLLIIEFHEWRTPMGPPVERRIGPDRVREILERYFDGRHHVETLGDNFYAFVTWLEGQA